MSPKSDKLSFCIIKNKIKKYYYMTTRLSFILETNGPTLLEISKQNFSNDSIYEEFLDSCVFADSNLLNCHFEDSEILGNTFSSCLFENCTFKNTIIRKSKFTNCQFVNCQFVNCNLAPRIEFFGTLFINCQFSNVDFSSMFLSECEFLNIDLVSIKLEDIVVLELKSNNITFQNLQFNEANPMRIFKSEKDFFLDEGIQVRNSLEFLKQIEMN